MMHGYVNTVAIRKFHGIRCVYYIGIPNGGLSDLVMPVFIFLVLYSFECTKYIPE